MHSLWLALGSKRKSVSLCYLELHFGFEVKFIGLHFSTWVFILASVVKRGLLVLKRDKID